MDVSMTVPADEIGDVLRVVEPLTRDSDERSAAGRILLRTRRGRREWIASDFGRLVVLVGGECDEDVEVILSPRLVHAAGWLGADDGDDVLLTVHPGENQRGVEVHGPLGTMAIPSVAAPFIDVDSVLARVHAANGPTATLIARNLQRLALTSAHRPAGWPSDERPEPKHWLAIEDGAVVLHADWAEFQAATARVHATTAGEGAVAIAPRRFADLLRPIDPESEVVLTLPEDPASPILVTTESWRGLLLPVDITHEALRPAVEEELIRVFGRDVVHRDGDGDYPLTMRGAPAYARLVPDRPVRLQIFAVVLDGVERSPDLLEELDDINRAIGFARCFHAGRQVLAEVDLLAETLDPDELVTATDRVLDVANTSGPVLAIRFGGRNPRTELDDLLEPYLQTVISVDVGGDSPAMLTGPDAVEQWPFGDERVFVITAWAPFGRPRPRDVDVASLADLAADLVRVEANFTRADGASADGSHTEPSFLVWDISEQDAVGLGRHYGQEAIFALDADAVEVIACYEPRRVARPRH